MSDNINLQQQISESKPITKQNSYTYWVDEKNKSRQLPPEQRPQKIQAPTINQNKPTQNGRSHWNTAGTWQHKTVSLKQIQKQYEQNIVEWIQKNSFDINIKKVSLNGQCEVVFIRNKKVLTYQINGKVEFQKNNKESQNQNQNDKQKNNYLINPNNKIVVVHNKIIKIKKLIIKRHQLFKQLTLLIVAIDNINVKLNKIMIKSSSHQKHYHQPKFYKISSKSINDVLDEIIMQLLMKCVDQCICILKKYGWYLQHKDLKIQYFVNIFNIQMIAQNKI